MFRYTYISQILEGTKECKIAAVTALVEVFFNVNRNSYSSSSLLYFQQQKNTKW